MQRVLRDARTPGQATLIETTDDLDIAITHVEDVGDLLDHNKALATHNGKGIGRNKDEWRHLAKIPMTVWYELMRQRIVSEDGRSVTDQAALRRWLNDSDNRYFRTTEGKA